MKYIYLVGGAGYSGYLNWIQDLFPGMEVTKDMELADAVFFAGGEDVNPELYGEIKGSRTYYNLRRDILEVHEFKKAQALGKKCIGVCRGGQFLTAMAGGKLVQHMSHPFIHPVKTFDNKEIYVSSTHHQQFLVEGTGVNYELLAYAEKLSPIHLDGTDRQYNFPVNYKEPEVVYYPDINAFACQSHPELIFDRLRVDNDLERANVKESARFQESINWCQQELTKFLNR